ncbi:TetR/AcrR family transcriptional regulator C-terminal domain-containing protein [Nocardia ninae]|uniref:TetR family transcriptional regulator n=1 Tax=Nocardia ninae NBRC 108245 TaxID=1210091 RepID=A0A511M5H0_9NOCA|nr:TetR/AcrR family transcriptional regulator C-terminal domain-containing protein [Nocardia ninae]GEM35870.1 TetR family transcriptional regulator [Nocardia ninae NBRC 108245]
MPGETDRKGKVGRPPRLSQDAIVVAADRLLRTEGADGLSMRRLAKELGSTPMALYHHVRDKDELLLLLLESHARHIPRREYSDDPRERLLEVACALYEGLAERPWIIEVLTSDPLFVPSAMGMVELMVAAAVDCGCSTEEAVDVYRTIWYYIVGDLIIRVNRERRKARLETATDPAMDRLDAEELPTLAAIADQWGELTYRDIHRNGLAAIVNGLLPPR